MGAGDCSGMAALYREIAHVLFNEGKDYTFMARHAVKMELTAIFQSGRTDRVAIATGGHESCEPCMHLEGKTFSISEAMRTMPLPVSDCSAGVCRCSYVAFDG